MSLLLDALKRAEEAKRGKPSDGTNSPGASDARGGATKSLSAEDTSSYRNTGKPPLFTPDLSDALSALALEEIAPPPAPEPVAAPLSSRPGTKQTPLASHATEDTIAAREAVQNMFTAKQTGVTSSGSKKPWLLPLIAVALVALGGAGWYVWNEVNKLNRPTAVPPLAPLANARPATPAPAPVSPPASAPAPSTTLPPLPPATGQIPTTATASLANGAPKVAAPEEAVPPLLPPAPSSEKPRAKSPTRTNPDQDLTPNERLAKSIKSTGSTKAAPLALKSSQGDTPPSVSPELAAAYNTLAAGDYAKARSLYANLVAAEPLNIDAQLGLASAAARLGDFNFAADRYRAVLALDPRNELALTALISLAPNAGGADQETMLRTLISANPRAGALHFALGNTLLADRRWREAQQAFFDAYALDSNHPDYAHNLAVSLDRLNQPKLAKEYYQRALSLANRGGAQFDRVAVARRIEELSRTAD